MPRRKTNEEFLRDLNNKNISYIPLDEYIGSDTKINFLCPHGHVFQAKPHDILNGNGCPYCSGRKPWVGETDMWTTRSDMARLLKNPNDGYRYTYGSNQILEWVCPICGNIIQTAPSQVSRRGLFCDKCSDGFSYAEKFIASMLNQLDIEFEHEKVFSWSNNKRYDFYVEQSNILIEAQGIQHYQYTGFNNRTLEEEQANDKYKRDIALQNGIRHYVQLDCRKSSKDYIYQSILNSELNFIFDLSQIDWNKCNIEACGTVYVEIANLFNSGHSVKEIADIKNLSMSSVNKYLKKMTESGLCNYNPEESHKNSNVENFGKMVICIDDNKIYASIGRTKEDGYIPQRVSLCCHHRAKTHRGKHFEFYGEVS